MYNSKLKKFVLSDLSILINLSKYKKVICFLCKSKKVSYSSFYEDELFLDFDIFIYFTLFESDLVNIILSNYG